MKLNVTLESSYAAEVDTERLIAALPQEFERFQSNYPGTTPTHFVREMLDKYEETFFDGAWCSHVRRDGEMSVT